MAKSHTSSVDHGSDYVCRFCREPTDPAGRTCERCGAGIDLQATVSRSGWESQPPIRDMARIQFGGSCCQIEGLQVPIADFNLSGRERIYFSHHRLLWCDPTVEMEPKIMPGGWSRMYAGVPLVMLQASGPGHLALSDDNPGEVIAVPLDQGRAVTVAEHRFLAATSDVDYRWEPTQLWYQTQKRDDWEPHYPLGRYLDVFRSRVGPGLVLLHAPGNTFVRPLKHRESICIRPTALVYADTSARLELHFEFPEGARERYMRPGVSHMLHFVWLKISGPGRVAIQSIFDRPEGTEPPVNIHQLGHTATAW